MLEMLVVVVVMAMVLTPRCMYVLQRSCRVLQTCERGYEVLVLIRYHAAVLSSSWLTVEAEIDGIAEKGNS